MLSAKFLLVVIVTLWLSVCDFHFEAYGDASGDVIPSPIACVNSPCQQFSPPPPPLSGYPSYGAPPPPLPPPPPAGYSIYGAPPPPHEAGQSKCPPTGAGVQCCTPPGAPYNTYGYGPPNPSTYVPYGGGEASTSMPLPILVPLMMLSSSFIFYL